MSAQETFVGRPDPSQVRELAKKLESAGMLSRTIQYSIYSYAGNGLTATLYHSGKFVVQGQGAESFGRELLGEIPKKEAPPEEEVIGTDESGKGDYFGSLVVAAVFVSKAERSEMRSGEIDDSKKLSDRTIHRLAAAVMEKLPYAIAELAPPQYNEKYKQVGNLNKILAQLHAQCILELSKKISCRSVLTDQFGDESLVRTALGEQAKNFRLDQRPRAEEDPAVAAASIVARDRFVRGLRDLSEEIAVDLPLGAGEEVEKAARKVLQLHGQNGLGQVAKLHFKTTQKVNGLF